jgi:hypothetical protein
VCRTAFPVHHRVKIQDFAESVGEPSAKHSGPICSSREARTLQPTLYLIPQKACISLYRTYPPPFLPLPPGEGRKDFRVGEREPGKPVLSREKPYRSLPLDGGGQDGGAHEPDPYSIPGTSPSGNPAFSGFGRSAFCETCRGGGGYTQARVPYGIPCTSPPEKHGFCGIVRMRVPDPDVKKASVIDRTGRATYICHGSRQEESEGHDAQTFVAGGDSAHAEL